MSAADLIVSLNTSPRMLVKLASNAAAPTVASSSKFVTFCKSAAKSEICLPVRPAAPPVAASTEFSLRD